MDTCSNYLNKFSSFHRRKLTSRYLFPEKMKVRSVYLFLYNVTQFFIWSTCLASLTLSLVQFVDECEAYKAAAPWTRWGLRLALLEVAHAAVGLAGGGVAAALVQALGRSAVQFAVLDCVSYPPCGLGAILSGTWAAGEIVRYAFYAAGIASCSPGWLLWMRYSLFLVLYPIGMVTEWLIYYSTLPEVDMAALHAIRMPNAWNFAFDFSVWNRIVLLSYFYFAPYMYFYMVRQRRKKIGPAES